MGYDMYLEGVTKEDRDLADLYRKESNELYGKRNALQQQPQRLPRSIDFDPETMTSEWRHLHEKAEAASEQCDKLRGYFRLNIWGMGTCRDIMWQLGMVSEADQPSYPKAEDFGLSAVDFEMDDDPEDNDHEEKAVEVGSPKHKYEQAVAAWRDGTAEGGLIPLYKLGSNDGWLVNPEEIANSLAIYDAKKAAGELAGLTDIPSWFEEWIEYLRMAKDRGGFRVH